MKKDIKLYIDIFCYKRHSCVKNKGYLMHNSDVISIQDCAFDNPCFLHRVSIDYSRL